MTSCVTSANKIQFFRFVSDNALYVVKVILLEDNFMNINKLNYSYAMPVPSPRPMAQNITDNLFSTLDPTNKGYFEKSDLKSLFDATTAEDSNQITNNLFSNFDSNSDGKVTKDEMTSVLEQFTGTIDNYAQANIQKQADMLPCHHHHFKPFDYGQGNASESPMVNETGTLAADSDYAINVSDIDTNNDGKITSSEIDIYFNTARNALINQIDLNKPVDIAPVNLPTVQENQMLDLVKTLQDYTKPVNDTQSEILA